MSAADNPSDLRLAPGQADALERVYRSDTWRAADLGVSAARGRAMVSFAGLGPP